MSAQTASATDMGSSTAAPPAGSCASDGAAGPAAAPARRYLPPHMRKREQEAVSSAVSLVDTVSAPGPVGGSAAEGFPLPAVEPAAPPAAAAAAPDSEAVSASSLAPAATAGPAPAAKAPGKYVPPWMKRQQELRQSATSEAATRAPAVAAASGSAAGAAEINGWKSEYRRTGLCHEVDDVDDDVDRVETLSVRSDFSAAETDHHTKASSSSIVPVSMATSTATSTSTSSPLLDHLTSLHPQDKLRVLVGMMMAGATSSSSSAPAAAMTSPYSISLDVSPQVAPATSSELAAATSLLATLRSGAPLPSGALPTQQQLRPAPLTAARSDGAAIAEGGAGRRARTRLVDGAGEADSGSGGRRSSRSNSGDSGSSSRRLPGVSGRGVGKGRRGGCSGVGTGAGAGRMSLDTAIAEEETGAESASTPVDCVDMGAGASLGRPAVAAFDDCDIDVDVDVDVDAGCDGDVPVGCSQAGAVTAHLAASAPCASGTAGPVVASGALVSYSPRAAMPTTAMTSFAAAGGALGAPPLSPAASTSSASAAAMCLSVPPSALFPTAFSGGEGAGATRNSATSIGGVAVDVADASSALVVPSALGLVSSGPAAAREFSSPGQGHSSPGAAASMATSPALSPPSDVVSVLSRGRSLGVTSGAYLLPSDDVARSRWVYKPSLLEGAVDVAGRVIEDDPAALAAAATEIFARMQQGARGAGAQSTGQRAAGAGAGAGAVEASTALVVHKPAGAVGSSSAGVGGDGSGGPTATSTATSSLLSGGPRFAMKRGVRYGLAAERELAAYLMDHEHFAGVPETYLFTAAAPTHAHPGLASAAVAGSSPSSYASSPFSSYSPVNAAEAKVVETATSTSTATSLVAHAGPGSSPFASTSGSAGAGASGARGGEQVPSVINSSSSSSSSRGGSSSSGMRGMSAAAGYAIVRAAPGIAATDSAGAGGAGDVVTLKSLDDGAFVVSPVPTATSTLSATSPASDVSPGALVLHGGSAVVASADPALSSASYPSSARSYSSGNSNASGEITGVRGEGGGGAGNQLKGSLQLFRENLGSGEDLHIGGISVDKDEVHKIGILDIRLLNLDRHSGNILITRDKATGTLSLVPIDHSYVLPSIRDMSDVRFEWLYFKQCRLPFSRRSLDYIHRLDPVVDAMRLRYLGFDNEAVLSSLVSTLLLQRCARAGLTLHDIGGMVARRDPDVPSALEVIVGSAFARTSDRVGGLIIPGGSGVGGDVAPSPGYGGAEETPFALPPAAVGTAAGGAAGGAASSAAPALPRSPPVLLPHMSSGDLADDDVDRSNSTSSMSRGKLEEKAKAAEEEEEAAEEAGEAAEGPAPPLRPPTLIASRSGSALAIEKVFTDLADIQLQSLDLALVSGSPLDRNSSLRDPSSSAGAQAGATPAGPRSVPSSPAPSEAGGASSAASTMSVGLPVAARAPAHSNPTATPASAPGSTAPAPGPAAGQGAGQGVQHAERWLACFLEQVLLAMDVAIDRQLSAMRR